MAWLASIIWPAGGWRLFGSAASASAAGAAGWRVSASISALASLAYQPGVIG